MRSHFRIFSIVQLCQVLHILNLRTRPLSADTIFAARVVIPRTKSKLVFSCREIDASLPCLTNLLSRNARTGISAATTNNGAGQIQPPGGESISASSGDTDTYDPEVDGYESFFITLATTGTLTFGGIFFFT